MGWTKIFYYDAFGRHHFHRPHQTARPSWHKIYKIYYARQCQIHGFGHTAGTSHSMVSLGPQPKPNAWNSANWTTSLVVFKSPVWSGFLSPKQCNRTRTSSRKVPRAGNQQLSLHQLQLVATSPLKDRSAARLRVKISLKYIDMKNTRCPWPFTDPEIKEFGPQEPKIWLISHCMSFLE